MKHNNIKYDIETTQYYIINDLTPGIYWLGNTKKDAIEEYFSSLNFINNNPLLWQ